MESEPKWAAIEQSVGGFPAKRLYRPIEDRKEGGVLIWEREWESRELMEAAYERLMSSPRVEALMEETRARFKKRALKNCMREPRGTIFSYSTDTYIAGESLSSDLDSGGKTDDS